MARLALLLSLCSLLLVAACGGGNDDAKVKDALRNFVSATNDRDGDRLCDDLVTQDYLERATGATGDEAEDACKQQLDLITGLRLKLVDVGEPKVDGDSATVRATITIGSQRTPRRFVLHKEDGDWKLASGS
jgi:Domain of unknown function (DUF4878)